MGTTVRPCPSWPVSGEPQARHVRRFCLPLFRFVPEGFGPVFRKRLHPACPLGPRHCVGVSLGVPGKPSATSGRSALLPREGPSSGSVGLANPEGSQRERHVSPGSSWKSPWHRPLLGGHTACSPGPPPSGPLGRAQHTPDDGRASVSSVPRAQAGRVSLQPRPTRRAAEAEKSQAMERGPHGTPGPAP